MKVEFDKPLIRLGVVGLIVGAVVLHCFGTKVFYPVAMFWVLLCYLWQITDLEVTWWKKLISVFFEACLWTLSAAICFGLSWCVDYIFGWHTAWVELHFLKGAILYIIVWQVYKVGLMYRWWLSFKQFAFYAGTLLLALMGGMFILRQLL